MSNRKVAAALIGALTSFAVAALVLTASALANTTITVTKTVCSGGGTKYCYSPEDATGTVGVPVTWVNDDAVTHNVALCPSDAICPGTPASSPGWSCGTVKILANGGSGSCTFTANGTYYYYCSLHGYNAMHGRITITGGSSPTPTPKPTPKPTPRPTPTPTHTGTPTPTARPTSSGQPTGGATAAPTVAGATPLPAGQTPGASPSTTATATAGSTDLPTSTPGQPAVGTSTTGTGGGGSGFPILILVVVVVLIAAGGIFAGLRFRRRPTA